MATATLLFTYEDGSTLYKKSAKSFIATFPVWEGNRIIDQDHVSSLETAIKSPKDLQGPFSVISYPTEENNMQYRVIDGQHRQEVLRRYFDRNPGADDTDVLIRHYKIKDRNEAIQIFQGINHAKPMIYKGSSTERLHEFVTALKRCFIREKSNGAIVALIRSGCNRPYLSTEILESALKTYGIHERIDLTAEQVVAHAESMNAFYSEDMTRLSGRFTKTTMDRAVEYGFYLGMDPKCTWLVALRSPTKS